ncbi:LacI family DNA-binding transcriptional regulator [Populibacterium corticicola]|uniref:LacI family DNA-binding transcriptional regulator n=1 Tax=Populibacterium corticicola TaxID=1812826 RepID=A0ABW5XDF1_9MICO
MNDTSTSRDSTPPDTRKTATLDTIAAEASVSLSTVSKVLNHRKGISEQTRERVWEVLQTYGYEKPGAQLDFAPYIDLVFESLDGEWPIELIRGAAKVAREYGMTTNVRETGVLHGVDASWSRDTTTRPPCGVILVSLMLSESDKAQLRAKKVPFVIVDPVGNSASDVPSVGSTNWAGGMTATRHLIELGHKRIGVVAGYENLMATRARVSGFRAAMDAAGLKIDETLIYTGPIEMEADPTAALSLLNHTKRPTAIFATSDVKALGVYEAARQLGLSIPEDLSVVGYDNLSFTQWSGPPMTTIRQNLKEMAMEAAKMIVSFREKPETTVDRIELATSIVVRRSTAAPRAKS